MSDPILRARLRALEQQLTLVEQSPSWLRTLYEQGGNEAMESGLRDGLQRSARIRKSELDEIRKQLGQAEQFADADQAAANRQAWNGYFRVQQESEAVFGECLRFLGGLAIRSRGFDGLLDTQIWEVADALVRSCALTSTGRPWTSLTVPAPREAVAKTLARMIRVRFPAWNVWTLPLAAREYGHVVAEEAAELPKFVDDQVRALIESRLDDVVESVLATVPGRRGKAQLKRDLTATARSALLGHDAAFPDDVHRRMHEQVVAAFEGERTCFRVLTADAYATYTLGVAYAGAALLLRFEPARAQREALVSDAERGEVVLAMLTRMNDESGGLYSQAIDRLTTDWLSVLDHTTASGRQDQHEARAKDFVHRMWTAFGLNLNGRYEDDDWLRTEKVKAAWVQRRATESQDFMPDSAKLGRLGDALNAAWSWRLDHPDATDPTITALEQATLVTCLRIIRPPISDKGGFGSVQPPTPAPVPTAAQQEPKE